MNPDMRKTLIAASLAALFASSMAFAGDDHDGHGNPNQHSASVTLKRSVSLDSDVDIHGDPRVDGKIDVNSAAVSLIDNRQSVTGNAASNDKLTNTGSIADGVASGASGNLGFNVAAGDNNAQDNAAALASTDASFAFGMADAEVYVNQAGDGNAVLNRGVINSAGIGGNAFSNASGNIGANVASGNNNEQKNALAASVATTDLAQSTISSNQTSSGNVVSNAGRVEKYTDTTQVSLSGPVRGLSVGYGAGGYQGSSSGSFEGSAGGSDSDFAANTANHGGGGGGGSGSSPTPVSGTTESDQSGGLAFGEVSYNDLYASLSGSVATTRYVVVDASNTAGLSGSAFANASGNIGVNVASGTGNLQANSLALSVAQPAAQ